ncbi:MAG: hypothetical protein WD069_14480 [Planctomycetales bacterium]
MTSHRKEAAHGRPELFDASLVCGLGGTVAVLNAQGIVTHVTRIPSVSQAAGLMVDWIKLGLNYFAAFNRAPHGRSETNRITRSIGLVLSGKRDWSDDFHPTTDSGWAHVQAVPLESAEGRGAVFAYERIAPREAVRPSAADAATSATDRASESLPEMFARLTRQAVSVIESTSLKTMESVIDSIEQLAASSRRIPNEEGDALVAGARRLKNEFPSMFRLLDLIEAFAIQSARAAVVPPPHFDPSSAPRANS